MSQAGYGPAYDYVDINFMIKISESSQIGHRRFCEHCHGKAFLDIVIFTLQKGFLSRICARRNVRCKFRFCIIYRTQLALKQILSVHTWTWVWYVMVAALHGKIPKIDKSYSNSVACRGLVMTGATAWLYATLPNSSIEQWRMLVIVTGYTVCDVTIWRHIHVCKPTL